LSFDLSLTAESYLMPKLEIAAVTFDDAIHAQDGGADSIEISHDLSVGGLTPSFDLVRRIRDALSIDVNVMVRPHARDFTYTDREIDQILDDATRMAQTGINGVVFGALTPENRLDLALVAWVAQACAPIPLTVHRALDFSDDPQGSLAGLIGIAPRVLTSGPAETAWEGRAALAQWVRAFRELSFVVSGGLKAEQIPEMLATVRAQEYHFGSAARMDGVVNVEKVRGLRKLVQGE
jgi:copper homeostasis protein